MFEGVREPLHPPPRSAPEVYMYTLLHRHYQHPSASAETPQTTPFLLLFTSIVFVAAITVET